jgi:hypothetical protein
MSSAGEKKDRFLDLFDADNVSPDLQRTRASDSVSENKPFYFAGGYARSLEELKERNEAEPIGKQVGGRRKQSRNRKGKGHRRSTYRRKSSLQRLSTYRRR